MTLWHQCLSCLADALQSSPSSLALSLSPVCVCMHRCDGSLVQLLPVSIDLTCAPFTCAVSLVPTDDGRYRCAYTPDRPGFYRLEVTCKGSHVCGSPFSVQVRTTVITDSRSVVPCRGFIHTHTLGIHSAHVPCSFLCCPLESSILALFLAQAFQGIWPTMVHWHPRAAKTHDCI